MDIGKYIEIRSAIFSEAWIDLSDVCVAIGLLFAYVLYSPENKRIVITTRHNFTTTLKLLLFVRNFIITFLYSRLIKPRNFTMVNATSYLQKWSSDPILKQEYKSRV
jgi:hypothetical protein